MHSPIVKPCQENSLTNSFTWEAISQEVQALREELRYAAIRTEQLRHVAAQLARENEQLGQLLQQRKPWSTVGSIRRMAGQLVRFSRTHAARVPIPHVSAGSQGLSVAFVGDGASGSWRMRGLQIAAAKPSWKTHELRCLSHASRQGYDIVCFVKRFKLDWATRIRAAGSLIVYDLVDGWKQPEDGEKHSTLDQARGFFRHQLEALPVDGVIFPNQAMLDDLGDVVPNPIAIYHHHRISLAPIEVKQKAEIVAYEGEPAFLGEWLPIAARVCGRLGLRFVVNPSSLSEADIGFAARGGRHATLLPRRYKSNVKLANFYAAGLPCVVHADEQSYRETDNGQVLFFASEEELERQLRALLPYSVRRAIHHSFLTFSRRFRVEVIASEFEDYFHRLVRTKKPSVAAANELARPQAGQGRI